MHNVGKTDKPSAHYSVVELQYYAAVDFHSLYSRCEVNFLKIKHVAMLGFWKGQNGKGIYFSTEYDIIYILV